MNRRSAWIALTLFASCGTNETELVFPEANLLLVSIDTTRADHLSCYGYERETTPAIDSLAREGHLFTAARTPLPSTLPAHASMFTSLYPSQLGLWTNLRPMSEEALTLAEVLRDEGFRTAAFISSAVLSKKFHVNQGFDHYQRHEKGGSRAERTCELVREWLEDLGDERFFCFVHLIDPHTWYDAPTGDGETWPPDRGVLEDASVFDEDVVEASVRAYDDELAYSDRGLALVFDTLERTGRKDETVVMVTSDHGETLDELMDRVPYAFDHGEFLYDHQLRVPLVMRLPETVLQGPVRHDEVVTLLDVMPTALELLDVPAPRGLEGRSLAGILRGEDVPEVPAVAAIRPMNSRFRPAFSVRTTRWHWIWIPPSGQELFDLAADPLERADVADEHPEVVAQLRTHLEAWRARAEDSVFGSGVQVDDSGLIQEIEALGYTAE